jgi:hypothetical protein
VRSTRRDPAQLALRLDAQHACLDAGHAGAVPARRRRWGRDLFSRRDSTLSSVGAGLDFAAGTNFNSKLLAARAMTDGLHTPAGSWRVSLQASVSY